MFHLLPVTWRLLQGLDDEGGGTGDHVHLQTGRIGELGGLHVTIPLFLKGL